MQVIRCNTIVIILPENVLLLDTDTLDIMSAKDWRGDTLWWI